MSEIIRPAKYLNNQHMRLQKQRNENFGNMLSFTVLSVGLSGCGGGGGGSSVDVDASQVVSKLPQPGNALVLTKSGSSYITNQVDGFSLINNESRYSVANDTLDNAYQVNLTAEGAGLLEFVFEDPRDTVVLLNGSTVEGFTQLKVTNGILDATQADLGLIDYISVASSIKINYSQMTNVSTLIANSSTSEIEIVLKNSSEVDQLASRVANGTIQIFSEATPLKLSAEIGSGLSQQVLAQSQREISETIKPMVQVDVSQEDAQLTVLDQTSIASMSFGGGDKFINSNEASGNLTVTVATLDKYTVKSVSVGGVALNQIGTSGKFSIDASSLQDGTHTIVAVIEDLLGTTTSLTAQIIMDTQAPGSPSISIRGESNGLSDAEASDQLLIYVKPEDGSSVDAVTFQGSSLSKLGSFYVLDASSLANGNYNISATVSDAAGNITNASKSFSIDRLSEDDAVVDLATSLNSSQSSGSVTGSVSSGSGTVSSVTVGGEAVITDENGNFEVDGTTLDEGENTVTVTTSGEDGSETTTTTTIFVDLTPPGDTDITVVGSSGGLMPSEMVDPVQVVLVPDADAVIVSGSIGGVNLELVEDTLYQFDASTLRSGEYDMSIISADEAGNQTTTSKTIRIFEGTTSASGLFDIKTSKVGDLVTFDLYFNKIHPELESGIPAYNFEIDLDPSELNFVEGSFSPSHGFSAVNENSSISGLILASGFYQTPFDQYENLFASFDAVLVTQADSVNISINDILLEYQNMGDFTDTIAI